MISPRNERSCIDVEWTPAVEDGVMSFVAVATFRFVSAEFSRMSHLQKIVAQVVLFQLLYSIIRLHPEESYC